MDCYFDPTSFAESEDYLVRGFDPQDSAGIDRSTNGTPEDSGND
jgi:hypothetical protein